MVRETYGFNFAFDPPEEDVAKTRRYGQYPRKLWADRAAAREPQPVTARDQPHPYRVALPKR